LIIHVASRGIPINNVHRSLEDQGMGRSKSMNLTDEEVRLAKIFKALGNPTRLAILKHLSGCQPCMCGNIVANLPLAQSTVSQHLKVLREAGLIIGEVEGPSICYCIGKDTLTWIRRRILELPW